MDIRVRIDGGRSRSQNEKEAWRVLEERVKSRIDSKFRKNLSNSIKNQVGSGGREDKIRSYRIKDNLVIDHRTGKTITVKELYKGKLNLLM